jgi:hypothetical protein
MSQGVFSLKKVYKRQFQNVKDNNFTSWPESAIYGYYGGGFAPPVYSSTISRLNFATETASLPGNNLPSARDGLAATSSASYGYFAGGAPLTNIISRLDFSNGTVSNPGNNLPSARSGLEATSSFSYGYFGGSGPPATILSIISRLDFTTELCSNPGNNLPSIREKLAAVSGGQSV